MEAPQKVNHELAEILISIFDFMARNLFGILSAAAGIAYQIYQMAGRTQRMSRAQCISSIIMWFVASFAIVTGLSGTDMNKLFYGLVCWLTPITVKPIADVISIRITPFTEKIIASLERLADSKIKNGNK